jgi:hypothetical protein
VNHDIDEIEQDPLRGPAPLDVPGRSAERLPQPLLDGVRDRESVTARGAVADDEEVGEDLERPEVEDDEVLGLLVPCGLDARGEFRSQRASSFRR